MRKRELTEKERTLIVNALNIASRRWQEDAATFNAAGVYHLAAGTRESAASAALLAADFETADLITLQED